MKRIAFKKLLFVLFLAAVLFSSGSFALASYGYTGSDSNLVITGPIHFSRDSYKTTFYMRHESENKSEIVSRSTFYVYLRDGSYSERVGTAVKIGSSFYVDEEDLSDWISMFNGSYGCNYDPVENIWSVSISEDNYVKKNTPVVRVTSRTDYYDEYAYCLFCGDDDRITSEIDPPYKFVNLKTVAQLCGAGFNPPAGSSNQINIDITSKPDTELIPEKSYIRLKEGTSETIKIKVKAVTYNKYNNNSMDISFGKVEGPNITLNPAIDASPELTPDASGMLVYEKDINATFSKVGVYKFSLLVTDGVNRQSAPRLAIVYVQKDTPITVPTADVIDSKAESDGLGAIESQLGLIKVEKPAEPSGRPEIRVPATEQFIFSVKFSTRGEKNESGSSYRSARNPSRVKYRVSLGTDCNPESPSYGQPIILSGNMVKCFQKDIYNWVTLCHGSGEDRTCDEYWKRTRREFEYRKIITVPKGTRDNWYTITVQATDNRSLDLNENIELEVYTPLRNTFRLKKTIDPLYPDRQHQSNSSHSWEYDSL